MQFRVTPFLVLTLVGILLCSQSPFLPRSDASVNPADLDALKQLFEKDPATAFEKSWKMFQEPRKQGDLEGMVEIIGLVGPRSGHYTHVMQDMLDAAVPVAQTLGRWETLGDLRKDQALFAGPHGYPAGYRRAMRFLGLATDAYAKAGKSFDSDEYFANHLMSDPAEREGTRNGAAADNEDIHRKFGEKYATLVLAFHVAIAEERDADAVALMENLLRAIASEPDEALYSQTLCEVAYNLWLRGSERCIPLLRQMASTRKVAPVVFFHICDYVRVAWDGRDRYMLDTIYWALGHIVDEGRTAPPYPFSSKLQFFHRSAEAERLARVWVALLRATPVEKRYVHTCYFCMVTPLSPPDVRRALVAETLRSIVMSAMSIENFSAWLNSMWSWKMIDLAPPGQERVWTYETGMQILDATVQLTNAERRAAGMTIAADRIEKGGRKDLADQARALATALAQKDPKALFTCTFTAAQSAANEGRWSDVEKQLEPALANPPETNKSLLDATLLLERTKRSLGKAAEADSWLSKAKALVSQVGLSAGERMNYLMTFANGTADKAEKTRLLEQAKQAATEAGLEVMQESITHQLTELAMETGNLAVAKQSLLNLINQKESKREHLAFDPLLRQKWFAENLGTYRKLLQVCAQTNDASTALWCGEQMRARALRDQLAWQKVDMAVQLPANLRKRFEQLRQQRTETYALLRQATGMPVGDESLSSSGDESRGFYIPIRGFYIPIRGPLADAAKATEDSKLLKQKLDELTHEEGALEALIREAVPAYRMAATSERLDANALLQRIPLTCGLLQYTLTPEGLVMVGVGPGHRAVVKQINVKPEELLKQVVEMRRRIMERSTNVDDLGAWWYKALVQPFEELIKGSRQVMIVADGALQLLPFAALQDADKHYLAEQYRLVSAPSIEVATLLRTQANIPKPPKSALIVAAPKLNQYQTEETPSDKDAKDARGFYIPIRGFYIPIRGEGGLSSAFDSMANIPLPGAKAEGAAITRRFSDATLLTGAEATKDRIAQEASKYRILHFATHGYADPEVPEFSGLLFAASEDLTQRHEDTKAPRDFEVLTAQQAYLWRLNADLVTLSACETGLGKSIEGEGLMGLTRAFLYAGAKDVVCSLWSVADESTAQLMEKFYTEWQKTPDAGKALQSAQLALMQNEKTRHPFYWAAFVAVQGPR